MPSICGPVGPTGIMLQMTICAPNQAQQMAAAASASSTPAAVQMSTINALLDTGASNTCVSPAAIEQAGLQPFSKTIINTAAGPSQVNQYIADVHLSMGTTITFSGLTITEFTCPINSPFQALLGMDIIMGGCLTISFDHRFTFSV